MKKWLIIGSVAAKHHFSDFRDPKDIDILTPVDIKGSSLCVIDTQWHEVAQEILDASEGPFASPEVLMTLKVSHAHWDVHWNKTLFDVDFFKTKGVRWDRGLYDKLMKVWPEVHGKKKVNLNQTVKEFFSHDRVKRRYYHEDLHRHFMFDDVPMYSKLTPDPESVWCDEARFEALSYDDKLKSVLEEMIVTAVERFDLDETSTNYDIMKAGEAACKKMVTSMTTGWFARFIILNHREILRKYREVRGSHVMTRLQSIKNLTELGEVK